MFRQPRIFRSDVDPCKYRTLTKPAFSNFNAALRTAWKGVGDALTNFTNLLAAAGPAGELMAVIAEEEKARVMVDRRYICCNSKPCAEPNFGLYGTALPGWNIKIDTRLPITLSVQGPIHTDTNFRALVHWQPLLAVSLAPAFQQWFAVT